MAQITLTGRAKGQVIELDVPLPYEEWKSVEVTLEVSSERVPAGSPQAILAAAREAPTSCPEMLPRWNPLFKPVGSRLSSDQSSKKRVRSSSDLLARLHGSQ